MAFQKRWAHRVKPRCPTCIKRTRVAVSPKIIRDFFTCLEPNLQDVLLSHVFKFDETNLRDDPCKYFYQYSTGIFILQVQYWYLHLEVEKFVSV